MQFPKINKQPMRSISIPELSGGMNLRESVSMVNDNQLTDCKNMWYTDGILKTRPAVRTDTALCATISADYHGDTFESRPHDIYKNVGGKQYRLISYTASRVVTGIEDYGEYINNIFFKYVCSANVIDLPQLATPCFCTHHYFIVQHEKILYCFTIGESMQQAVYKLGETDSAWTKLTDLDFYAPIIMTHCKTNGSILMSQNEIIDSGGVMFEGYNLLCKYYRMVYSSVNKSLLPNSDSTHPMTYSLLNDVHSDQCSGKSVIAYLTNSSGTKCKHSVVVSGHLQWDVEQTDPGDGLYMGVCGNMLHFFTSSDHSVISTVGQSDYVEDNLEITAPYINTQDNLYKVFLMSRTEWFGSAAEGINGGARLFLGGNELDKEKNLILWSGLNNPLYFPENCYAYVGNSMSSVTAFGKQSDMLIIFKENETYFTRYTQNTSISADDLINQNVVDYTASRVYFPMIHLHATIGCDCPDTVQLCRNRLAWANRDGHVYTLITNDQYSERNIYDVSEMITKKLKTESGLSSAYSCDWDGRYLLFCKNHVYVMDYNSYGYVYASSYSKTDDANARIPWDYWELSQPETAFCAFTVGDVIGLLSMPDLYCSLRPAVDVVVSVIDGTGTQDQAVRVMDDFNGIKTVDLQIISLLQTKIFDFGAPSLNKNVPLVNIAFGSNKGVPVTVSFLTESGTEQQSVSLLSDDTQTDSLGYIQNVQFRPCARLINRFGIRIECNGFMAIDAISLNYRLLGGSR